MRMRKKPNLIPRMEACSQLWIKNPEEMKGKWRSLKPDADKVRLELGCGKGRFTAETAARNPQDLYVAVERVADAMVVAMERCRAMGLHNVFFIDGDAAELDHYFAEGEVDLLYINFCDPWPSVKHSRRRLTHEGFLRGYRKVLRDGGEIHFKTDNHDLFEWSLFQFPKAGFELSQVTRDLHANGVKGVMTDYEEKFHQLGTPINRCVGTKVELPDIPFLEGLRSRLTEWELRPVKDEDLEQVLALLRGDPEYYKLVGEELPTLSGLRAAMSTPLPRSALEQRSVVALWRNGSPQVLLDWAVDYPRERTLWIAFLMVDKGLRGQGIGRTVADALPAAAREAGMDRLRLNCLKGNESGHAFWSAAGFQDLRDGETPDGKAQVWVMERLA